MIDVIEHAVDGGRPRVDALRWTMPRPGSATCRKYTE